MQLDDTSWYNTTFQAGLNHQIRHGCPKVYPHDPDCQTSLCPQQPLKAPSDFQGQYSDMTATLQNQTLHLYLRPSQNPAVS